MTVMIMIAKYAILYKIWKITRTTKNKIISILFTTDM